MLHRETMAEASSRLSRSAVDRAGDLVRRHQSGDRLDPFRLRDALDCIARFRSEWAEQPYPLVTVNMGLRSMVKTVAGKGRVSQRLKRASRIIDKLVRFPRMRLTQMQDVGGCRAVVPALDDVLRLRDHISRTWTTDVKLVD